MGLANGETPRVLHIDLDLARGVIFECVQRAISEVGWLSVPFDDFKPAKAELEQFGSSYQAAIIAERDKYPGFSAIHGPHLQSLAKECGLLVALLTEGERLTKANGVPDTTLVLPHRETQSLSNAIGSWLTEVATLF